MSVNKTVFITKASGQEEAFDIDKLRVSLQNAGATEAAIAEVSADIQDWIYPGVSTGKIYSRAFKILKQVNTSGALLYRLKKSLFEMGPSGYPFEHFIGEIFRRQAFQVKVGIVIDGASVSHEMDVVASKDNTQILGECKYSHNQGFSVSVQVPLYVHSRVNDIVAKRQNEPQHQGKDFKIWIFTNGRFSPDSIEYSKYYGIQLMGWNYPPEASLKQIIQRERMFPITIMSNLSKNDKHELMARGIVTCKQLAEQPDILQQMSFSQRKIRLLQKELEVLMKMPDLPA